MKRRHIILLLALWWIPLFIIGSWDNTEPADTTAWNSAAGLIRNNWDALEAQFGVDLARAHSGFNVKDGAYGALGDGSNDDTAEIQAAIDACEAAGGGMVYFPDGQYIISSALTVDNHNVQLVGEGRESHIDGSGFNGNQILVSSANFFVARNLYVEGSGSYIVNTGCINLDTCNDFLVEGCYVTASSRQGIRVTTSSRGTIRDNIAWANYQNGIMVRGTSTYILVEGNICYSNVTAGISGGIHLYNATDCIVLGNICHTNAVNGIQLESDADRNTVEGNYSYNNTWAGISLHTSDECLITGNYSYSNTLSGIINYLSSKNSIIGNVSSGNTEYGISQITDNGTNVTDNLIQGNYLIGNTLANILVDWDCLRTTIMSNDILNGSAEGILINRVDCVDTVVTNNHFYNNSTTLTDSGTTSTIRDNTGYVTENSGTATLLSGNTTVVVAHGCTGTPTVITITWRENPTNLIADWWVDTIGATNFTLNGVDPGASNLDFGWEAKVR
jgi:parallel beta-helix repeat protein